MPQIRSLARGAAPLLRRWARGGARPGVPAPGRVGLLLNDAWGTDGTTRITLEIAGRIARRHDVEVISLARSAESPFHPFPDGVAVTALDDLSRVERRLARHLQTTRPALLIGSRPELTLAALAAAPPGTAIAAHERERLTARPPSLQRAIAARYPSLGAVVVETRDAEHALLRALGPRAARIVRIPPATRELGGPRPTLTDRVILAAGRLGPQADFATLLDAFALVNRRHPHWQLRICGDGPGHAQLAARAGALGLGARVSLPGTVSTLGEEMGGASVFVSTSPAEDCPLALLEAMAKGLPVVTTGPRETVVDRENGRRVAPYDPQPLAEALIELIEDEPLRRRLGEAGAGTAGEHRMELVGPQWDGLVASLARAPAPARPHRAAAARQTAASSSSVGSS